MIRGAAEIRPLRHGLMADFSDEEFPCQALGINTAHADYTPLILEGPGTIFGYLTSGRLNLLQSASGETPALSGSLTGGQFFSIPVRHRAKLLPMPTTRGFIAYRKGYLGLQLVGDKLEPVGRLKYIDGCSDTLLIAPPLKGDPCLNMLHFPRGISQTKHTHPSVRIGLIYHGRGLCHTADGTEDLHTSSMFILAPDAVHAFETTDSDMRLVVFHPDSDFGPTHEEHPMLNRTIVDGVSAKDRPDIQTQEIR